MAFRAYIFLLNRLVIAEIAWAFGNMDHIWIVRFLSMVRKCFILFQFIKLLFLFSAKLDVCFIMMSKNVWTNETWFKFDNLSICFVEVVSLAVLKVFVLFFSLTEVF